MPLDDDPDTPADDEDAAEPVTPGMHMPSPLQVPTLHMAPGGLTMYLHMAPTQAPCGRKHSPGGELHGPQGVQLPEPSHLPALQDVPPASAL